LGVKNKHPGFLQKSWGFVVYLFIAAVAIFGGKAAPSRNLSNAAMHFYMRN